jgi:excisionase family DNA binding protein
MNNKLVEVSVLVQHGVGKRSTIYSMIACGQIPFYRCGRRGIRVCLEEVLTVLRRPARAL